MTKKYEDQQRRYENIKKAFNELATANETLRNDAEAMLILTQRDPKSRGAMPHVKELLTYVDDVEKTLNNTEMTEVSLNHASDHFREVVPKIKEALKKIEESKTVQYPRQKMPYKW